jgi:hypothetical protein
MKRISDSSVFRVRCPVCEEGILMVCRHQESFELVNVDRCTRCAQMVIYTDKFINGEPVLDITVKN